MVKFISISSAYVIVLLIGSTSIHLTTASNNLGDGSTSDARQLKTPASDELADKDPANEGSELDFIEPQDFQTKGNLPSLVYPQGKVAWFSKGVYGNGDKRNPAMYSFGLGKRSSPKSSPGPYSFGLGKRSNLSPTSYSFGLGKRDAREDEDDLWRRYARNSGRFGFGLGKRVPSYSFGLGKRNEAFDEDPTESSSPDEYPLDNIIDDNEKNDSEVLSRFNEVEPEKRIGIKPEAAVYPRSPLLKLSRSLKLHAEPLPLLGKRLPVYNFGLGK